jgi:hypothetical protein
MKTKVLECLQFWLRKDFQVSLVIPQDMTKAEGERLIEAIKTQILHG